MCRFRRKPTSRFLNGTYERPRPMSAPESKEKRLWMLLPKTGSENRCVMKSCRTLGPFTCADGRLMMVVPSGGRAGSEAGFSCAAIGAVARRTKSAQGSPFRNFFMARTIAAPVSASGFLQILEVARSGVEHLAHFPGEGVGSEGLLKKGGARIEDSLVADRVIGVAGHEEHPHVRPRRSQPLCQLQATHPGHHDIGDHELDRPLELPGDCQSLVGVGGRDNRVPLGLQDPLHERADRS